MNTYHNTGTMTESVNAAPKRGWSLCKRWPDLGVKLEQQNGGQRLFRVTYGLEVRDRLTYSEACEALGAAMLHSLCCDGDASNVGE